MSGARTQLKRIEQKVDALARNLDNINFQEYLEYANDRKRMYKNAFRTGLLRGLGTAVGFTILGAITLYLLRLIAGSSIPLIGEFIAKIVKIVDSKT